MGVCALAMGTTVHHYFPTDLLYLPQKILPPSLSLCWGVDSTACYMCIVPSFCYANEVYTTLANKHSADNSHT